MSYNLRIISFSVTLFTCLLLLCYRASNATPGSGSTYCTALQTSTPWICTTSHSTVGCGISKSIVGPLILVGLLTPSNICIFLFVAWVSLFIFWWYHSTPSTTLYNFYLFLQWSPKPCSVLSNAMWPPAQLPPLCANHSDTLCPSQAPSIASGLLSMSSSPTAARFHHTVRLLSASSHLSVWTSDLIT